MFKKIFIIFILETETAETYSCTMTVRFFSLKKKKDLWNICLISK